MIITLYCGISYYILDSLVSGGKNPLTVTANEVNLPYVNVSFPSRVDHVNLKGWLFTAKENLFTVIFVHGINTNRISNKHTLHIARDFVRNGANVLLFDLRNKGQSEGKISSGGFFETRDVLGAFDYLTTVQKIPSSEIGVLGFSMGGATSVLAVSKEPRIKALAVEAPYSDARKLISQEASIATSVPIWITRLFLPGVKFFGHFFYRINFDQMVPMEAVKNIPIPIFFIHGKDDTRLKPIHSQLIKENAHKKSQLWLVPKTTHTDAYNTYPKEYIDKLIQYYKMQLQTNSN